MRDTKEGVSLAAIVAKETVEGSWSGSGSGLGFGTAGLGFFVGGMSGKKREQSKRAKEFAAPPESSFNWGYVYGPVLILVFIATFLKFGTGFVSAMSDSNYSGVTDSTFNQTRFNLEGMMPFLSVVAIALLFVGAPAYYFAFSKPRKVEESKRFKAERAADEVRLNIYNRLRYVEQDHVVFDPVTGLEVAAEKIAIQHLIWKIAAENGSTKRVV